MYCNVMNVLDDIAAQVLAIAASHQSAMPIAGLLGGGTGNAPGGTGAIAGADAAPGSPLAANNAMMLAPMLEGGASTAPTPTPVTLSAPRALSTPTPTPAPTPAASPGAARPHLASVANLKRGSSSKMVVRKNGAFSFELDATSGLPKLAETIHAAVPRQLRVGVAIMKIPAKVHQVEATWDTRMLNMRKDVRTMAMTIRPWYIVHPTWTIVHRWEIVMAMAMMFVSTATPFEVMVMRHTPPSMLLIVTNYCVDFLFFCDMVLHFFMSYSDKANNQWVYDIRLIAGRYMFTWWPLDFISIFPFAEVAAQYPELATLRVVRIVRLVKLTKLARVARMGDALALPSGYITLCKFSFLLLLVTHFVACTYCLIAQLEEFGGHPSWETVGEEEDRLRITGSASRYLHAIEFAIFAMVLTFARAFPCTVLEQSFAIAMLVMMGCLYAYVIGLICGIISTMDPAGTDFSNKKDLVKAWTNEVNMPADLKSALTRYTDECRHIIRQRYYRTVLEMLSPNLRGQVSQFLYGGWMANVTFFQCDDERESTNFTMAIAELLSMLVFAPSEVHYS